MLALCGNGTSFVVFKFKNLFPLISLSRYCFRECQSRELSIKCIDRLAPSKKKTMVSNSPQCSVFLFHLVKYLKHMIFPAYSKILGVVKMRVNCIVVANNWEMVHLRPWIDEICSRRATSKLKHYSLDLKVKWNIVLTDIKCVCNLNRSNWSPIGQKRGSHVPLWRD
jgi:hypothetical protein